MTYARISLTVLSATARSEPGALYPPISISAPIYPSEDDIFLIVKSRDIAFRIQNSVFHITKKAEEKDIVRYSDRNKTSKGRTNMLQYFSEDNVDTSKYIPAELLAKRPGAVQTTGTTGSSVANHNPVDINLGRLEQQETAETSAKPAEKEDGSDIEVADGEEPDEFELDDDYGVDHYASDGGGDSGGDDEPTF